MPKLIVSTSSENCTKININSNQSPAGNNGSSGEIVITASVGISATNLANDVSVIQDALNRVSPDQGGPSPLLVIDGACGPKTKNAIQQFQLKQFGWSGADGKINPGGQTITRLNVLVGGTGRPTDSDKGYAKVDDAKANEVFKAAMTAGLMLAKRWIQAAQANLDIALVHVDQPNTPSPIGAFGREERMRLANRYFRIDNFPASQRRLMLQRVRFVYATMLQVFERPGGLWGERTFEIDSTGVAFKETSTALAHTDTGGFFKGGQPNQFQKELRGDTIFFVRENIIYFADLNKGTKTIVHELAHFCGEVRSNWEIDDFDAYGEPETPRVSRLTLAQRVRHADTYARFAKTAGS
jgi:hypothetical protein